MSTSTKLELMYEVSEKSNTSRGCGEDCTCPTSADSSCCSSFPRRASYDLARRNVTTPLASVTVVIGPPSSLGRCLRFPPNRSSLGDPTSGRKQPGNDCRHKQ